MRVFFLVCAGAVSTNTHTIDHIGVKLEAQLVLSLGLEHFSLHFAVECVVFPANSEIL